MTRMDARTPAEGIASAGLDRALADQIGFAHGNGRGVKPSFAFAR